MNELGWYKPNNDLYFVKVEGDDIDNITFFNDDCPFVETRTYDRAVIQAGGAYYKKYLKYKNKYFSKKNIN